MKKNIQGFAVVCYYSNKYQKTYTIHRFGIGVSDLILKEAVDYLYQKLLLL